MSAFGLLSPDNFEEFDPGSDRTLAAWLRHASRTDRGSNIAVSGERVRNAWVTYPKHEDSFEKSEVILDETTVS